MRARPITIGYIVKALQKTSTSIMQVIYKATLFLLCVASGSTLYAAETPETASSTGNVPRPRIGLVFSGGGARGAAHVGALKVIEEMHIPIDAVAGTSMGAVVGGLYASGMSAADIEKLLFSVDWQTAFSDRTPRRDLGFRRKQDDRNFLVRYSLGISNDGVKLPTGLIQGQKLSQVLRGAALPVAEITDFDRLPIPFRAIATDLETGEAVVMGSGDLVTAMRASMSAPGVFIPAEREGRLLVDGGVVKNLPVDVMRKMNVDVLIVVDVTFALYSRKELTSPLEITLQASAIMMRSRTLEQRALLTDRDIIIDPQLGTYGSTDFMHVAHARAMGEEAARGMQSRLATLSLDEAAYKQYLVNRNPRASKPQVVAFVHTDEGGRRYQALVADLMQDVVGKPLDKALVERRMTELYALDLFESVDYTMVEENGESGIEFHLRRKSWGPNYVRFGLNIEDDFKGNSRYNAAARFIATELNPLGGEWLTDFQIGDNPLFHSEFYQPLGYGHRYFIAPHVGAESRSLEVHDVNDRITEYRVTDNQVGLDFGRELHNWGEWRVGAFHGTGSSKVRVGDTSLPNEGFRSGGYFGRLSYDKLDSVYFPRDGQQMRIQWTSQREEFGADRESDTAQINALIARSFGKHTIIFSADAGSTLNDQASPQDFFELGGFLNLSGLRTAELSGPHFGIGRFIYYRQVGRGGTGVFEVPLYAGFSFEAGNVWQFRDEISFNTLRKNMSLFMGADTFLGPVYLGAGVDQEGSSAFYLFLGRTF
jgi:NTE family protein